MLSLSVLDECVPTIQTIEHELDDSQLADAISAYLRTLNAEMRKTFLYRYYSCNPIRVIAESQGVGEAKIYSILQRIRKGLRAYLQKEAFTV